MTQERLYGLKLFVSAHDIADQVSLSNSTLNELISALEQAKKVESLIVQIFESGGDLRLLGYGTKTKKFYSFETAFHLKECESLNKALEFILERTRKQEEQQ